MRRPNQQPAEQHSTANRVLAVSAIGGALAASAFALSQVETEQPTRHKAAPAPHHIEHTPPTHHTEQQPEHKPKHERQAIRSYLKNPHLAAEKPTVTLPPKPHHKKRPKHNTPVTETPSDITLPDQTDETGTPPLPESSKLNMHPENAVVPDAEKAFMGANVVRIDDIRCSAMLVRDVIGSPIGALTAQHCRLDQADGKRSIGPDGQRQVNFISPLTVRTGSDVGNLVPVADITQFQLNADGDNTKDVAVGAFAGISPETVAANAQLATPEELTQLSKGELVLASGYPVDQPRNTTIERQDFAMHYLGSAKLKVSNPAPKADKQLQMQVAALPANAAETECSYGMSGANGYVLREGGKRLNIGVLSGFIDLTGNFQGKDTKAAATKAKEEYEGFFGVNLDGYGAICMFAAELPNPANGGFTANVATQYTPHEGGEYQPPVDEASKAKNLARAEAEFTNPTISKTVVNGILQGRDGYVQDPLIFYNYEDGSAVAAYCMNVQDAPGNLVMTYDYYPTLSNLPLNATRRDGTAPILNTQGEIQAGVAKRDVDLGSCVDSTGLSFGRSLVPDPTRVLGPAIMLAADKGGELYTLPYLQKGGVPTK